MRARKNNRYVVSRLALVLMVFFVSLDASNAEQVSTEKEFLSAKAELLLTSSRDNQPTILQPLEIVKSVVGLLPTHIELSLLNKTGQRLLPTKMTTSCNCVKGTLDKSPAADGQLLKVHVELTPPDNDSRRIHHVTVDFDGLQSPLHVKLTVQRKSLFSHDKVLRKEGDKYCLDIASEHIDLNGLNVLFDCPFFPNAKLEYSVQAKAGTAKIELLGIPDARSTDFPLNLSIQEFNWQTRVWIPRDVKSKSIKLLPGRFNKNTFPKGVENVTVILLGNATIDGAKLEIVSLVSDDWRRQVTLEVKHERMAIVDARALADVFNSAPVGGLSAVLSTAEGATIKREIAFD